MTENQFGGAAEPPTSTVVPAGQADPYDSMAVRLLPLETTPAGVLAREVGVSVEAVRLLIRAAAEGPQVLAQPTRARPQLLAELRLLRERTYLVADRPLHIVDVNPRAPVVAGRPFTLEVELQNLAAPAIKVGLAVVTVEGAGVAFSVAAAVDSSAVDDRIVIDITGLSGRTLSEGRVAFVVDIYRDDGARTSFRRTVDVLPVEGLSVHVGHLTAGAVATGDADLVLRLDVRVANGTDRPVTLDRTVGWQVRSGAAEAVLDAGSVDWSETTVVPPLSVWYGRARLNFAAGGPVADAIAAGTAIDLVGFVGVLGSPRRSASGPIRLLRGFGINVIVLADLTAQQRTDLDAEIARMENDVFLNIGLALRGRTTTTVPFAQAQMEGFAVIDDEVETRKLFASRNGTTADFIDVFVVDDINWSNIEGFTGAVPGPVNKGGDCDGSMMFKFSCVKGGIERLRSPQLSLLIGHEIGHYLGEADTWTSLELMYFKSFGRTNAITPAQRATMEVHCLVFPQLGGC